MRSFTGEYPKKKHHLPFQFGGNLSVCQRLFKEHEDYLKEAQGATALLQDGNRGYRALWEHVLNVSIADLKKKL